jgi:hypothetical protein
MNKKIERIATIGLAAFLVGMFCYQVAYGTSAWKYGYTRGLLDGKASERDSYDTCTNVFTNSTSDANACDHGYDLAFKKGCDLGGYKLPSDPHLDYPSCKQYFNYLSHQ